MWDFFSKVLNIVLGLLSLYFYFENRKLKSFQVDRDLEIKKLELQELRTEHKKQKEEIDGSFSARGLYHSGLREKTQQDLDNEYERKIKKIEEEIKYLEKLKRYKWLFSK